jgi:homoserine kinase
LIERLKNEAVIAVETGSEVSGRGRGRTFEVRVPASTSNLGAGFDCFGLALKLYLTVRATVVPGAKLACRVRSLGEGESEAAALSRTTDNLIFRAMQLAAEREGWSLPPVRLAVHNELPLGRGLGSSAAAIVAGLTLCACLCERNLSAAAVLRYGLEMEGHADNIAPSVYGGWVVTCVKPDGSVLAVKRRWPPAIKVIVVSPDTPLKTALARSALPRTVALEDAVYNLQRAALFGAVLDAGGDADELLWEAMQDRLHQVHRQSFVPGLAEALATPRQPGLVGLALSGAGPSVIALARERFAEIGESIAGSFRRCGTNATARLLEVDDEGRRVEPLGRRAV